MKDPGHERGDEAIAFDRDRKKIDHDESAIDKQCHDAIRGRKRPRADDERTIRLKPIVVTGPVRHPGTRGQSKKDREESGLQVVTVVGIGPFSLEQYRQWRNKAEAMSNKGIVLNPRSMSPRTCPVSNAIRDEDPVQREVGVSKQDAETSSA